MNSTGKIAVIIPHISDNTEIGFIDAINNEAAKYGYDTIVISGMINYVDEHLDSTYAKAQNNIYNLIYEGDFDGYIFEANIFCSEKQRNNILNLLHRKNKPCVVVNYDLPYFPVVSADETVLLYLSTLHLIKEHNCKKLYCIGGYANHLPSEMRIDGFRKAMAENNLEFNEKDIFYGDYWRIVPRKVAADIAEGRLEMPDGIVCGNDIMAVELSRKLTEYGIKVPDDIKITGCDGSIISQTERISITTVAYQERINGYLALYKLLEGLGVQTNDEGISPELVIGKSCGCSDNCSRFRDSAYCDIMEYAGVMFDILEKKKTSSHGEIIRRMSECKNLYDVTGTFLGCCYMIPTGINSELCLCQDWCRSMNDPSLYRKSGFSENMLLAIDTSLKGEGQMQNFNIKDIFPSLTVPHKPRLTVITSLHFKGQIFGYIGFTYSRALEIILDEFYMSWCDAVGSGLNSVQNTMYKEYINEKIESLSEYAPVLGIYNRRGLISKLSNQIAENSNTEISLTMFSYINEKQLKYDIPPIHTIVNAIRLGNEKNIMASISENIIAVVSSEKTEQEFIEKILHSVEKYFKGAVEIKAERIVVISHKIMPCDIFGIDSIISEMIDELKGKIINYGNGVFSYDEEFVALRNEIYEHPEKDWNIEIIGKSLGISKSHFHRIYKNLFGCNCKDDIIDSRLKKAKWYLENTSLHISQISEKCGYANNSHFIRQFTERTGITPSNYRKTDKGKV